jgi:hypothetical protein
VHIILNIDGQIQALDMVNISHLYIVANLFDNVTPFKKVHADPKCDCNVIIYGYLHGSNFSSKK